MENLVACACSSDVYQEPNDEGNEGEAAEVLQVLEASKCAEILGLNSPDVSYLERRRAYIKAALVMSRLVGPSTPWNERAELARRGANSFADVEAALEGLRSQREAPPGFAPDDFLPQLRCSRDGGRTFDSTRPAISAMLQADVRTPELTATDWEISVKFSTTRFVLSRQLEEFVALHKKLRERVPACARALPALPQVEEIRRIFEANARRAAMSSHPHDKNQATSWWSPTQEELTEERRKADAKRFAAATRKLRSWLAQAIDWFRARRAYDPDLLQFIDLDPELLLRLHREDMRVVRNVVVSWGGHVAHAIPSLWVRDFVASISPRRGKTPQSRTAPGPIKVIECIDQMTNAVGDDKDGQRQNDADSNNVRAPVDDLKGKFDVVTKPAWVVLSAVYGADVELDLDNLRKIQMQKGVSTSSLDQPPTSLLGLPVGTPPNA